ncbi:opioid-binding protein/cell adhesion molecule-like isoform X1 [Amphibalanus amphitrite]|uniref:opioid-binding protein/cell adhesion molecule-like isoform X1 n=1 Tax=Amphibalanus amphitrite TaxID=1232801 RepID=UPI001C9274AB|nr:opioid-binding protein/cell adhesion molecule-like isoform X1 [Amphibalanus amphitrite]XP_043244950.1 opioid-binding protein/cell adhesion molecule-like isoform X1 [Amphibalanus amphitrite]
MWCAAAALLTLLVVSVGGAPQLQDDEPYPEELAIYDAQMVSESESLVVREGANISLPCQWESERAGDIIVLWKKRPNIILFTGSMKISEDERVHLGPNNELRVTDVTAGDGGTYVCIVAVTPDPIELEHTVSVKWPAKLHPLDTDHFQVREGESFELICGADGNPEPTITWSKLPTPDAEGPYVENGDPVAPTSTPEGDDMAFLPENPSKSVALSLDPVQPRHTGTYTCTAQNGVGKPDVLTAKLEVTHAPYIAQDTGVVRTAHGMTAEVGCKVFANPRAEVIWQRNGHDLPISSRYETAVSSRYFSLRIRDVKDEDFGNYTCRAKNQLGQNENHITLTGLPGPVELHLGKPSEAESGRGQSSTTVTWEFISYSTVEETSVTLQPLLPAGFPEIRRVPTVTSRSVSKKGQQQLSPLNENTTYLVRVAARNQYGWTPPADVYFSITDGELKITQAPPKLAESKTASDAAARLKLTPILLIAILSSFF